MQWAKYDSYNSNRGLHSRTSHHKQGNNLYTWPEESTKNQETRMNSPISPSTGTGSACEGPSVLSQLTGATATATQSVIYSLQQQTQYCTPDHPCTRWAMCAPCCTLVFPSPTICVDKNPPTFSEQHRWSLYFGEPCCPLSRWAKEIKFGLLSQRCTFISGVFGALIYFFPPLSVSSGNEKCQKSDRAFHTLAV